MKNKILFSFAVALATVSLFFTSCEDDVSGIGSSISSSEVNIHVDSLTYSLLACTIEAPSLVSRSDYNLLGSIRVPEYGSLDCSYVTQFLPAENLNLPDTITYENIDSVKIIMSVPKDFVTGDSLAPQQMKVYSLTKQLPSAPTLNFNPEGYFDPSSPLASKSYTLSGFSFNDTTFVNGNSVSIKALLPTEIGRDIVKAYSTNPDIFVWPQEFAKYWPGIYVTPTFGKGCIAPVSNTSIYAYYPQTKAGVSTNEDGTTTTIYTTVADSVCLLTTAPEIISSVNIDYQPSEYLQTMIENGSNVITTPGGYTVKFTFPAKEILDQYWSQEYDLGVINNMVFSLPVKWIQNSYNIGIPPALLMIKNTELDTFFAEGKLPDNLNSFTSIFSSEKSCYTFDSMRQYIVDLRRKGADNIQDEDVEFTLIPVTVSTEDYTNPNTGVATSAITSVEPYIIMPTMMEVETDKAQVVFTFSNEILN